MAKPDCLFLHIPKLMKPSRSSRQPGWISYLPAGLLALADLLHRQGVSTQVVHLGVESAEDRNFSILSYLREATPRMVAIDLHWHHQSFDVMETVKKIKAAHPQTYLFLGGFTASFFHEEIMKNFDGVDGIIRGEAEGPIGELAKVILRGENDLFSVPNLTWRRKGRVLVNPLSYVAEAQDLNDLCFTNFSLLKNHLTYLHRAGQSFGGKDAKERGPRKSILRPPIYHLAVGRGCPAECTWCSGNIPCQETVTGRTGVVFRSVDAVLKSIQEALVLGYQTFHISFDPYPADPEYFLNLFSRIREERLKTECIFESFGLPKPRLIRAFGETFPGPRSRIVLSPDVGSDRVRRIHKGYAYTNGALKACLGLMKDQKVFCDLFFTWGVPFEKEENIGETIQLQKELRRQYPNITGILTYTLDMEPGSPWHLDPEAFGVKTGLRDFMDFCRFHSGETRGTSSLGYWIPGCFEGVTDQKGFEERIRRLRQRHFYAHLSDTARSSAAFWGRRLCDLSSLLGRAKSLAGKKSP